MNPTLRDQFGGSATRTQSRDHVSKTGALDQQWQIKNLLKMIVSNLLPLEITEDVHFLHFIKTLSTPFQVPSKAVVRSELLSVYEEKKEELRCILASADNIVLTCELWTSRPEDSYLTVGCHFVDKLGNLKSYMLKTTSLFGDESAANIQNQLSAVMESWGVRGKVHSVVRAGMPQLKSVKAKWTHMPCFAETLREVFKDLMSNDELSKVLTKCQNIIRFFECDSEAEKKLREIQRQLNMNQEELIMYSGDQWSVWLQVLQRLLQQYNAMVMVFDERGKTDLILNKNDKEKIQKMVSALEPLREATSMMKSGGFETISVVVPLLRKLMGKLEEEERRNNEVARKLLLKCKNEFGDLNKLTLNTFLDPRYKPKLSDQTSREAMDKVLKELSAEPGGSSSRVKEQLQRYLAYQPTAERSNPLAWWRHTGKTSFGELSEFALKKLCVVSTAVPLDRAFSRAGDQFCLLRSCIEPEDLDMVLFLNSNWPHLGSDPLL